MRRLLALLFLCAACGGKGAIFVTIEARGPEGTLRIPDDIDSLSVKVTDAKSAAVLLEKDYPLTGETFPLTLGLEQGSKTSNRVNVEVHAFHATKEVGAAASLVPIDAESITNVTMRIDTQ